MNLTMEVMNVSLAFPLTIPDHPQSLIMSTILLESTLFTLKLFKYIKEKLLIHLHLK